jgi:hypothetical protein
LVNELRGQRRKGALKKRAKRRKEIRRKKEEIKDFRLDCFF